MNMVRIQIEQERITHRAQYLAEKAKTNMETLQVFRSKELFEDTRNCLLRIAELQKRLAELTIESEKELEDIQRHFERIGQI